MPDYPEDEIVGQIELFEDYAGPKLVVDNVAFGAFKADYNKMKTIDQKLRILEFISELGLDEQSSKNSKTTIAHFQAIYDWVYDE